MQSPSATQCILPALARISLLVLLFVRAGAAHGQVPFTLSTNNGALTITKYNGPGGAVTIPSVIQGLPVTMVGDYAFDHDTNTTAITIPGTVTNIGTYAFQFSSLTSANLGEGVTHVGFGAFSNCEKLTNVFLPGSLIALDTYAFRGSVSLASVTLPEGVGAVGNGAFFGCHSLIDIATVGLGCIRTSSGSPSTG